MKVLIKNVHCRQNMGRKHSRDVGGRDTEGGRHTETHRETQKHKERHTERNKRDGDRDVPRKNESHP